MLNHKPEKLEDELCFSIYSAQRFYNHFYTESLRQYKLTYPQYITLLVLWEDQRPMMIKELGRRLNLDTGTLTPLLKRMEKNGWITRSRTGEDGRKVFIELTDHARNLEENVKERVSGCMSSLEMDNEEYKKNVAIIREISEKLYKNNRKLEELERQANFG